MSAIEKLIHDNGKNIGNRQTEIPYWYAYNPSGTIFELFSFTSRGREVGEGPRQIVRMNRQIAWKLISLLNGVFYFGLDLEGAPPEAPR